MTAAEATGTLRREIALADAADAARDGDLDGARLLLEPHGDDDPEVLHLRARILAQGGDLDGADDAWRRLEAVAPGDPGASAGRRAVARARGRSRRRVAVGGALLALLVVARRGVAVGGAPRALLVVAVAVAALRTPGTVDPPAPGAAPPAVGSAPSPADPPAAASTSPAAGLAAAVAGPGVRSRETVDGVEVTFDGGLFVRGAELGVEGERTLVALGTRLAGRAGGVEVVGRSVVVPGGPVGGGSPVAFDRAARVAAVLAPAAGLPLTAFSLRSAEQSRLAGDAAAQERTVSLLITPGG